MKIDQISLNRQVQLWGAIGPFIALASLVTIFFKEVHHAYYFGWIFFLGGLFSWLWKLRGAAAASFLSLTITAYYFSSFPEDKQLWILGMMAITILTFFIIALSYSEIEDLVHTLQKESKNRLKSLLHLDEKVENIQEFLYLEKKSLEEKNLAAQQELTRYDQLIQILNNEIEEQEKQLHERSVQVQDNQHQLDSPKESLLEKEKLKLQGELGLARAIHRQLREQFYEKQEALDEARRSLFNAEEELLSLKREMAYSESQPNEVEEKLHKQLFETEKEYQSQVESLEREVDLLHEWISEFFTR